MKYHYFNVLQYSTFIYKCVTLKFLYHIQWYLDHLVHLLIHLYAFSHQANIGFRIVVTINVIKVSPAISCICPCYNFSVSSEQASTHIWRSFQAL